MSRAKKSYGKSNPLNSLFFKCTLVVVSCILAVVITLEIAEGAAKQDIVQTGLDNRSVEVTQLIAMQMGGSIKFSNTKAMEVIVNGVVEQAKPDLIGAHIVNEKGEVLLSQGDGGFDPEVAQSLVPQVLDSGAPISTPDSLYTASPVFFGDDGAIAGVVVTGWTLEHQNAILAEVQKNTLLTGLAVMVVATVIAGFFLRNYMSRPLIMIERAMGKVAEGDYDSEVPSIKRGDEIGKMARRLDGFRLSLSEAKGAQRESAFKSAAFSGSTAPMMMVDDGFKVLFVNPACEDLLAKIGDDLATMWSGITAETVVGSDLGEFSELASQIARIRENGAGELPMSHTAKIGDILVRIKMNAAYDASNAMIGAVIEWSDRSEAERNAALLGTIDKGQLRLEFLSNGICVDQNENCQILISPNSGALTGKTFADLFGEDYSSAKSADELRRSALSGEAIYGRFAVHSENGSSDLTVEGSFTSVTGPTGAVERVIFLGTDVTASAKSMEMAEESRAKVEAEQQRVVQSLGVALTSLADGDLTCDITAEFPADYEKLRQDFNAAVEALREAVGAVMHNADSIRNETSEITSAADDLSRRTEKQAATLEETAAALDELTSSVRSAAEGADEASTMSEDAQRNAEKGGEIAREAVHAMDGIKTSSQEISKITTVIDDIAFQTNLLSLNAGVEAARAGEAGRGFAVVATEVRALAQRSSDAAREINDLISSSGEQVQQGVDLVDKTGAALASIVISVSEISKRVSTIATSSREQSTGLNEINTAVNELDHVTQQNAAMFEETTAASHALTSEADALAAAVARFDLGRTMPAKAAEKPSKPNVEQQKSAPVALAAGNTALKVEDVPEIDEGWEEF